MYFKQGSGVFTADGLHIGRVERVVLDPHTKAITHVVVRKGFLFIHDIVVPIRLIDTATKTGVKLRREARDLGTLSAYKQSDYVALNEDVQRQLLPDIGDIAAVYWYPPFGDAGEIDALSQTSPPSVEIEHPALQSTIHLAKGAHVIAADGQYVGDVTQILINPHTHHAMHFVTARSRPLRERIVVPVAWLSSAEGSEVRLDVASGTLDHLRIYRG